MPPPCGRDRQKSPTSRAAGWASWPSLLSVLRAATAALALWCRGTGALRQALDADRMQEREPRLFPTADHRAADAAVLSHSLGRKPICIVSHHSTPSRNASEAFEAFSADNHLAYALRHDYRYWRSEGRISGAAFVDAEAGSLEQVRGGGLYWQKLSALAAAADRVDDEGLPLCRWLMWIDPDAIFTNFHVRLESILQAYQWRGGQKKQVVLAAETAGWPHNLVNSGVFFVENTWRGRAFLEGVARTHDLGYRSSVLADQDGLTRYAFGINPGVLQEADHAVARAHLRPEIALAPQRLFNSFYWLDVDGRPTIATTPTFNPARGSWHRCDFVGHLAGVRPAQARLVGMRQMDATRAAC